MDTKKDIASMRMDYAKGVLDEQMINPDPLKQFRKWFEEAVSSEVNEPNIMILSTVSKENKPSSRVVLLKDITDKGFTFYTNYQSNKGQEIEHNNHVSLLFMWTELQRQVRIEGTATKVSEEESTTYFNTRPLESRIGACVSAQSSRITNRSILDQAYQELFAAHQKGQSITKPKHWGGYLVSPRSFEFWQGRQNRLHDRIYFSLNPMNNWELSRLAP
jgi:pyridoxamine-phosphate oxidase